MTSSFGSAVFPIIPKFISFKRAGKETGMPNHIGWKNSGFRILISSHNKTNQEMDVSVSSGVIYALHNTALS